MRTTLTLDAHLAARAREAAAREGISLDRLIEEGLRLRLSASASLPSEAPPLPVFHGGTGLAPGIDPASNRSVRAALDESDLVEGKIR